MAPSRMEGYTDGDDNTSEGETSVDENSSTTSLLIVILSLIFVAVFGCALIGGVISGDPTNGFFITIIVASALAISVAIGIALRMYSNRDENIDQYLSKKNKGTFSTSDEENPHEEEYVNQPLRNQTHEYHYANQSEIKEIQAKSVLGEMSALSPHSYGGDSISTFRHHIIGNHNNNGQQGFDFSRITPGEQGENGKKREDPPEGVGEATMQAAWSTRGSSQDPSAPKFSINEELIGDECDKSAVSAKSGRSERRKSRSRSSSKSKSPSAKRNKKGQKIKALKIPSSTKSAPIGSMFATLMPSTPAASEAGSFASGFINMFGKGKKASSEVGASNVISSNTANLEFNVKKEKASVGKKSNVGKPPMVRPPMLPPSNKKGEQFLKTIDGRIGSMPSTPGNKSTFTIPPPRPVPRTPAGSEFYSEFQSVVGSTAASSTFDPVAHQRALEKMRNNQASIGASPAMPIYYNDDDDDDDDVNGNDNDKESSVAPNVVAESSALSYDVFAPPGALGIVVDTTEKGCIVYSLKKSSPLQGLMNRGDVIIGLDNFDVRNMSAALLTKLMAKKSEQAERKFTLVPDNS